MFSLLTDSLTSLLYPQFCGVCGILVEKVSDGAACAACWNETKLFTEHDSLCLKCGAFLAAAATAPAGVCGQCDDHLFDLARSAGSYHSALSASVLHLKRVPSVPGRVKSCILGGVALMDIPVEYVIIPVPLSKKRKLERGFNQAELLAAVIAKASGLPIDEHSLIRDRDTPMHRAAMDRKARAITVKNAFKVVRPGLIKGKNILLVDDLMTSGSTASQCARSLMKSGAAKVFVLTLARAE